MKMKKRTRPDADTAPQAASPMDELFDAALFEDDEDLSVESILAEFQSRDDGEESFSPDASAAEDLPLSSADAADAADAAPQARADDAAADTPASNPSEPGDTESHTPEPNPLEPGNAESDSPEPNPPITGPGGLPKAV